MIQCPDCDKILRGDKCVCGFVVPPEAPKPKSEPYRHPPAREIGWDPNDEGQLRGLAMLSDDNPIFKKVPLVMREAAKYLREKEQSQNEGES